MGKAAMCLQMLQILNTGRVYKISELAGLLDTNPRNIVEYKKELDEIGCFVDTIPGRYGGYKLNYNAVIPSINLTEEEKRVFIESFNHLLASDSFVDKEVAIKSYSKIMSNLLIEDKFLNLVSVNKYTPVKDLCDIKKHYDTIQEAIKNKKAIIIDYNFLKMPIHKVKVHPYELFIYDNEWRFIGWSCETNDVFYYKLSRINDIEKTNEPFRVWKGYKLDNYLKDGIFTPNGELFPLTLVASGIRAKLFRERSFGKNQSCEELPGGKVRVTLEMQKNPSTYNFILSCGDLVEVIEPEWLRDKVKSLAQSIVEKYK